ncbi:hypothetical protein [Pirellula sp. SH-Sr6A]|uniref:hypothetical protein n=1 Tax=Pirellula sp. SH-Sr6A TaxID=1632865 RepID=UPI0011BAA6C4|nr:hypothetical protein [Pirellula sp. SH-Sr6A]
MSPQFHLMKVNSMCVGENRVGSTAGAKRVSLAFLILGLVAFTGCGSGGPSLVKAKGKVMVDGNPAPGAIVLLHPEPSTNSAVANGVTDANGVFAPLTGTEEGIAEGTYRVTVVWPDPKMSGGEGTLQFGASQSKDPPDLLKGRYVSRDKSKLSVTVSRSSPELPPLELTTK